MEPMTKPKWVNWLFHSAKMGTLAFRLGRLVFGVVLILGITALLLYLGNTSDSQPHTLQEFAIHLKHHGLQLKELRTGLYLYLSENPDMTLGRCTGLPYFPDRVNDWRGVVVVSQREINNITIVPDSGSRHPECAYAFSIGAFDVFGDPTLVRRIRASFLP
jgi:hypothetical protein